MDIARTERFSYPSMKMLLVLLFLAGQLLGIFHLVEHMVEGGSEHCDICAVASHSGDTMLPTPAALVIPQSHAHIYLQAAVACFAALLFTAYTSRAPPR